MFDFPRLDRSMEQMNRMLSANRRDVAGAFIAGTLSGDQFRSAAFRCMGCGHKAACDQWLSNHEDLPTPMPPAYCRNRETILSMPLQASDL
ncbi:DUF6455 family protein [Pelagibacterium limicola]|uniref:DUF6455 family protein n=1 Tax=Pelagibacterium limicola TaxID=2791022 RepID=UPI002483F88D|nr:DUF6455 family protein [Pelagibacterium limicola]